MYAVALSTREDVLPQLRLEPDLFGRLLWDHYQGRPGMFYLRRDDNYVERSDSARYFRSWEEWPGHHRCLLRHARGRVLDCGAGAGGHALALQERGLAVTAIDLSPGAVEVCRVRGVRDARLMDARDLAFADGAFDTIVLLGNTLGIAGDMAGLETMLRELHRVTQPGAQILADVTDYTATHDFAHLRYHQRNTLQHRYPGAIRLRLEAGDLCSPQFDWLLIKLDDLRDTARRTGWRVCRCVQVMAEATYMLGMERL